MGVTGLLSHCLRHRSQCVEEVNLVEVAQQKEGGLELLVDFYSFEHLIVRQLWASLTLNSGSELLRLMGGEYRSFDEAIRKLYTDLKSVGITLVIFIDGAKGCSKEGTAQKLETWKQRHQNDMDKLNQLLSVLWGQTPMSRVPDDVSVRPVLLEVQIIESLKMCGCEIVQCPSGEADFVLARNLIKRSRAFAILSNDSDFCIFRGCAFVPNQLFDLDNDLCLGKEKILPEKPVARLRVGVIYAERVGPSLQLKSHEELVELSIIAGNDYTGPTLRGRLRGKYGLHSHKIQDAAAWVRKYRRAENQPAVRNEMQRNPQFDKAVKRSRLFYNVEADGESSEGTEEASGHATAGTSHQVEDSEENEASFRPNAQSPHGHHCSRLEGRAERGPGGGGDGRSEHLSLFISDQVLRGRYPGHLLAMHHRFYWHRMLLEDCSRDHPSAEAALADLRAQIYQFVLQPTDRGVIEYGRFYGLQHLTTTMVQARHQRGMPSLTSIDPERIFQNLRTFARIITHYEPNFHGKFFERYGWKRGFIWYLLRYFLVLNCSQYLFLEREELMSLVALVFCEVDVEWYQKLKIRPTVRSVTVGNWFQALYRLSYNFVGSLLYLRPHFPQPWEIFSGAVWTAFYFVAIRPAALHEAGLSPQDIGRVRQDRGQVLHDNRNVLVKTFAGYL